MWQRHAASAEAVAQRVGHFFTPSFAACLRAGCRTCQGVAAYLEATLGSVVNSQHKLQQSALTLDDRDFQVSKAVHGTLKAMISGLVH